MAEVAVAVVDPDDDALSTRTEDLEIVYAPDGFEAYYALKQKEVPANLIPQDQVLTEKDIKKIKKDELKSLESSVGMVEGGPLYAKMDMIAYDMLCVVQNQEEVIEKLKEASEDKLAELSKEYYENEIRMEVINSYSPPDESDDEDDYYGHGYGSQRSGR